MLSNGEGEGDGEGHGCGPGPCSCGEHMANVATDDRVRWSAAGGTAYGRVAELREGEDDEPFEDEISGDAGPIGPPAALIEVYRPEGGEWTPTDTFVAHRTDTDTLTVIESFPEANTVEGNAYYETMTDHDITDLAERSAFDADTLRGWDEGDLDALAESLDEQGGGGDPAANTNEELRERVEALESVVEEQETEKRERLAEQVAANTDHDAEELAANTDEFPTPALETLAEYLTSPTEWAAQGYAGRQGNAVNRLPQAGAQADPGDDDDGEAAEELGEQVGALAQMGDD